MPKETKKYNHFEYGKMLADKLKPIQGRYYKATEQTEMQELSVQLSEAKDTILIAVDGAESSFSFPNSDSLLEYPKYSFAIVSQTDSSDVQTVLNAQNKCKEFAKQIIAKMLQDAIKYKNGLEFVDGGSFKIAGMGPVGDNFYGVLLTISFSQGISYCLNKSMWED